MFHNYSELNIDLVNIRYSNMKNIQIYIQNSNLKIKGISHINRWIFKVQNNYGYHSFDIQK